MMYHGDFGDQSPSDVSPQGGDGSRVGQVGEVAKEGRHRQVEVRLLRLDACTEVRSVLLKCIDLIKILVIGLFIIYLLVLCTLNRFEFITSSIFKKYCTKNTNNKRVRSN